MDRCNRSGIGGFTLVELAVVVLVVTLLLGSLLIPLATQVEQRNVSETQKRLQEIKEALIAYAIANGRFPCPAVVTGASSDSGKEAFAPAIGNETNGNCSNFFNGYVPGVTLGLSNVDDQGFVVDAWGLKANRIRYAVHDGSTLGSPYVFTGRDKMRAVGVQLLGKSSLDGGSNLLFVCASAGGSTSDCGTATKLTSDAVFVVYSLGKNAATTGALSNAALSADERVNINAGNNRVFVSRVNSSGTLEFDDLVLWASRYNVVSQLIAAGQLP
jgi:type II secretory pathway pseudopilin PulG